MFRDENGQQYAVCGPVEEMNSLANRKKILSCVTSSLTVIDKLATYCSKQLNRTPPPMSENNQESPLPTKCTLKIRCRSVGRAHHNYNLAHHLFNRKHRHYHRKYRYIIACTATTTQSTAPFTPTTCSTAGVSVAGLGRRRRFSCKIFALPTSFTCTFSFSLWARHTRTG